MKVLLRTLPVAVVLALAGQARADVNLTWSFFENGGAGNKGVNANFNDTTSTYVLPTQVVTVNPPPQSLYVKGTESFPAGNESGLGIQPDDQDEINPKGYVHFDFSALKLLGTLTNLTFTFGSLQKDEGVQLYADNTGSTMAASPPPGSKIFDFLPTDNAEQQQSYTLTAAELASNSYFNVIAYGTGNGGNPNILVNSVTATFAAVPEPSTMAIAGLAGAGMIIHGRRSRRRTKTTV